MSILATLFRLSGVMSHYKDLGFVLLTAWVGLASWARDSYRVVLAGRVSDDQGLHNTAGPFIFLL
jgi:hypothetical protein